MRRTTVTNEQYNEQHHTAITEFGTGSVAVWRGAVALVVVAFGREGAAACEAWPTDFVEAGRTDSLDRLRVAFPRKVD